MNIYSVIICFNSFIIEPMDGPQFVNATIDENGLIVSATNDDPRLVGQQVCKWHWKDWKSGSGYGTGYTSLPNEHSISINPR